MKALKQCFSVELFIIFYNAVLTFESMNDILTMKCDHLNESH